jgi:hypothetical protein
MANMEHLKLLQQGRTQDGSAWLGGLRERLLRRAHLRVARLADAALTRQRRSGPGLRPTSAAPCS